MDMMNSQQYYQIFEDSYGRITNGNNPANSSGGVGITAAPTINKGVHPPSPIGSTTALPSYSQHPGNYDSLGNYNPMSPVGGTTVSNMRHMGSNPTSDGWGNNYPGSELDFPPQTTATGIPTLNSYNPNPNSTNRFSPHHQQQNDNISVLNNYNTNNHHSSNDFYNLTQQVNVAPASSIGTVANSNMEILSSSLVFSGNNGSNISYEQSLMLPSSLNEDNNRFGSGCSPAPGVNDTPHVNQPQQLHYNGNIALKVEPNTHLDTNGSSNNNLMLLQTSTNSSPALICNTSVNSSSSISSALLPPQTELVSTTSVSSGTNPTSFFQPSPNYLGQSSPAGSALSPSGMNNGNLGQYYVSHPPPASSTSPPSSLHSEFGDDAMMGNSVDLMGSSASITTSGSVGKRKTGGVSKAATSTTGKLLFYSVFRI